MPSLKSIQQKKNAANQHQQNYNSSSTPIKNLDNISHSINSNNNNNNETESSRKVYSRQVSLEQTLSRKASLGRSRSIKSKIYIHTLV